jgi:cytosine/adenosine deaminase-related metal-dependent hydrolase
VNEVAWVKELYPEAKGYLDVYNQAGLVGDRSIVAHKVAQLRQQKLWQSQALFLATLGGAKALNLEDRIGNFEVGKEADFIVLDLRSTPLMAFRNPEGVPTSLAELGDRVFSLVITGRRSGGADVQYGEVSVWGQAVKLISVHLFL